MNKSILKKDYKSLANNKGILQTGSKEIFYERYNTIEVIVGINI